MSERGAFNRNYTTPIGPLHRPVGELRSRASLPLDRLPRLWQQLSRNAAGHHRKPSMAGDVTMTARIFAFDLPRTALIGEGVFFRVYLC